MSLMRRLEREQAVSAPTPDIKLVREQVDPYQDLKTRVHRKLIAELEKILSIY